MTGFRTHAYARTRVAIKASQLFSRQQLEELVGQSLEEIASGQRLDALTAEGMLTAGGQRPMERTMMRGLMLDQAVLIRPFSGPGRELLDYWGRKYELFNLKALIRGKIAGLDAATIEAQLYDLRPLNRLDVRELLQTENVAELLRTLEQGPYHELARQARQVYEQKNEPFSLDATIDQGYYSGLMRQAKNCDPEDRPPLTRLIGTLIDQQNLLWLLRYRFVYQLPPSETYYLLVPQGLRLHRERLLQLVEIRSFEQVLESLPAPLNELLADANSPSEVESRLEAHLAEQARLLVNATDSAVASALAYLMLRELDLRRLFAVIRGKALQIPTPLIRFAVGLDNRIAEPIPEPARRHHA